ncbi:MAG: response regulator [candidate division Zixibacteria bacterium]|nr:response regulator [candidate division Zixibacteria bacterium]
MQLELENKAKPRILVVEDEATIALDLKHRLERLGYEVPSTVANGRDAIRLIKEELPDIILMDILLPGDIDGIETASLIKKEFDIPIVFMSAISDTATIDRAKSAAPAAYLLKPYKDREIKTTIEISLHRHILEAELRSNRIWLQTVLWSIGDAVIASDCQNQVVFMNPAAEMLTGHNADNSIGKPIKDVLKLIDENTGQHFEYPTRKRLEESDDYELTRNFKLINKSGNGIPIEITIDSMKDKRGGFIGCVSVFRDITNLRETERLTLQKEKELKYIAEGERSKLQTIVSHFPDFIAIATLDGQALYLNPAGSRLVNLDPSIEISTLRIEDFHTTEYFKLIEKSVIPAVFKNGIWRGRLELKDFKTGEPILCEASVFITKDNITGNPLYLSTIMRDIRHEVEEERKKEELQIQLEKAERMKSLGLLAGGVAHDLNNVLGPLVGYPELIMRKLPKDSPVRKQLKRIERAARDAASVVQDLLTMARRGRYELVATDSNEMIREYLDSPGFEDLARRHPKITIKTEFDPDLSRIRGSSPHLSKVIMNLIVNAMDAMGEEGELTIRTFTLQTDGMQMGTKTIAAGAYVVISVKDTGCGIRPEDMSKIFEPYFSNKEMQGRSGSGLGLSVVYAIVKDHQGYYDIQSELGKGTEFKLFFPATNEAMPELPSETDVVGGTETILVVDDVESQRLLLADSLSALGYKVITAKDGRDAINYVRSQPVDLVMLDMILEQELDGLDSYRAMLEHKPVQKAIIVSGFSANERVAEALDLGVGKYIKKPFDLATLAGVVREELDKTITVVTKADKVETAKFPIY